MIIIMCRYNQNVISSIYNGIPFNSNVTTLYLNIIP